jgi:ABC-2 type transport system permease protein
MSRPSTARQLVDCLWMSWRSTLRDLGGVIGFVVVFPIGFLFFLGHITAPSLRVQVLVGSIMMEMALLNINVVAQGIGADKDRKLYDLYVSLPISPLAYVLSIAFSLLPFNLGSAALTLLVGEIWFGLPPFSVPALLIGLLLVWASTLGIGFLIAVYGSSPRQINTNAQLIGIIMTFLAPVFYPISVLPTALQYVAYLWPVTWGAILLQQIIHSNTAAALQASVVLAVFAALWAILISVGLRWRTP